MEWADFKYSKVKNSLLAFVIGVCVLPTLLMAFGMDFGNHDKEWDISVVSHLSSSQVEDALHNALAGSFTHTVLEWSALFTAFLTFFLSIIFYLIKRQAIIPIIGIALFCAGIMDAFHTLAADRLILTVADNHNLIPFTWTVCRLFNVCILMAGAWALLVMKDFDEKTNIKFVLSISLVFGVIAYLVIYLCATSNSLPETTFPLSLITRPWDLLPLVLYLFAGFFLFPRVYIKNPGYLSYCLILSIIPQVMTQVHMAFGSSALFDNHFNVGHFLKIFAYFIPFIGLSFEFMQIYIEQKRAEQEAEKANQAKSEFLSRMSHELRTPLHAILGYSQLLQKSPEEPLSVDQEENVEQINKSGKHLMDLINEVLDLARIESGKMTLSIENVHLASLVKEILTLIQPMADQFRIEIIDQITDKSDHYVLADRIRLKQVLLNLISNAVKYNRKEGFVTLSHKRLRDERLRISVLDTGLGIPEDKKELVFQPFNRLDAENSNVEGTGIGLTICRRLMEHMNGIIDLDSVPGKGSCFYIELPMGDGQALEAEPVDGPQKTLSDQEDQPQKEHIVLYVEDNPANLNLVKKILRNRPNIELLSAPEAQLGLDLARAHRPDLILMDINLPGMDGLTALKHLKGYEETRDIPVIAVSANAMEKDVAMAMSAGFNSYIIKPFDIPKFLETIDENLNLKFTNLPQIEISNKGMK